MDPTRVGPRILGAGALVLAGAVIGGAFCVSPVWFDRASLAGTVAGIVLVALLVYAAYGHYRRETRLADLAGRVEELEAENASLRARLGEG